MLTSAPTPTIGTLGARELGERVAEGLLARNHASRTCFAREAPRLAEVCREMAARFLRGGRLLAFGSGPYATDAQHISVEFVHPVIVGKRALPALDLSIAFSKWAPAICRPDDIAVGFAPAAGDPEVSAVLSELRTIGAYTLALSARGRGVDYALDSPSEDPFIEQELIEILYHTLWETVHVFFEHREMGHEVGEAGFLYPFLGNARQDTTTLTADVARSIETKARDVEKLREDVVRDQSDTIARTVQAMHRQIAMGGKLILFGNGGSATDANDWAIDCVAPPKGYRSVPAVSLSMEPANISAIANDVGPEVVFLRQLIAHAEPKDVAVALSTSGGSANIVAALIEARKRGLLTVALLGNDGGEIVRRGLADSAIVVRSDYSPRIQEVHASIYHVMRDAIGSINNG